MKATRLQTQGGWAVRRAPPRAGPGAESVRARGGQRKIAALTVQLPGQVSVVVREGVVTNRRGEGALSGTSGRSGRDACARMEGGQEVRVQRGPRKVAGDPQEAVCLQRWSGQLSNPHQDPQAQRASHLHTGHTSPRANGWMAHQALPCRKSSLLGMEAA